MTEIRPDQHELTYVELDEKGYGDGLDDVYVCACGEKFQANGDIVAAFEHGIEVGRLMERVRGGSPGPLA